MPLLQIYPNVYTYMCMYTYTHVKYTTVCSIQSIHTHIHIHTYKYIYTPHPLSHSDDRSSVHARRSRWTFILIFIIKGLKLLQFVYRQPFKRVYTYTNVRFIRTYRDRTRQHQHCACVYPGVRQGGGFSDTDNSDQSKDDRWVYVHHWIKVSYLKHTVIKHNMHV